MKHFLMILAITFATCAAAPLTPESVVTNFLGPQGGFAGQHDPKAKICLRFMQARFNRTFVRTYDNKHLSYVFFMRVWYGMAQIQGVFGNHPYGSFASTIVRVEDNHIVGSNDLPLLRCIYNGNTIIGLSSDLN